MPRKRITFIRTDWGVSEYRKKHNAYGGIGYYRIIKPAQALAAAYPEDYEVQVLGQDMLEKYGDTPERCYPGLLADSDLVITKEIDGINASNLLALAKHFGKPLLVDSDDNFLAIRNDNPASEYYGAGKQDRYMKAAFLSLPTGLVVSTEPLMEAYTKLNPQIHVLPNCNDLADWPTETKRHNDGMIRVGYAGGVSHNADLEHVRPYMLEILKKYPNVRFEILGAYDKPEALKMIEQFQDVADRIQFFAGTPSWTGYPQALASMGWDIGIAPLVRDDFNVCKSHIKWMEYSSLKIPTVASNTYPYSQMIQGTPVIEQGKTGFLVKPSTPEYWITYVSQLIEQLELRQQVGQNAYNAVKNNWQWSSHIHKWKQVIDFHLNGPGTRI